MPYSFEKKYQKRGQDIGIILVHKLFPSTLVQIRRILSI